MAQEFNQTHAALRAIPLMLREMALPAGFAIVAILLWISPRFVTIPASPATAVDPAELIVQARRTAMADPQHHRRGSSGELQRVPPDLSIRARRRRTDQLSH